MRRASCAFVSHCAIPSLLVAFSPVLSAHTPLLYRLLACSIVLYLVRRWVIGCLDGAGARRVGRSCFGWRALLAKQRWHCRVETVENTPLRALELEAATGFDMANCLYGEALAELMQKLCLC